MGLDSFFAIEEIDIFTYANNSGSYTATRSVAAYLKGIASALSKPLIVIDSDDIDTLNADDVAKKALAKYMDSNKQSDLFPATKQILFIYQYRNIKK